MTLINQARSLRADRLISRLNVAHRLRLLQMEDSQNSSEALKLLREELQAADDALNEVLVMIDDLKALILKLSTSPGLGEGTPDVSWSGSDHSDLLSVS